MTMHIAHSLDNLNGCFREVAMSASGTKQSSVAISVNVWYVSKVRIRRYQIGHCVLIFPGKSISLLWAQCGSKARYQ